MKNYVMHVCILTTRVVKKMIHKETHPEKKRHAEKRRKLSVHADLSHSLLARTQSEIRVLNPQTQEEVFIGRISI